MKKAILAALLIVLIAIPVAAADGVINVASTFNVKETADRMESILNDKGMTIFKRIKHSEAAGEVGIELRETELIWEDEKAKVWISYNDPRYLEKRHNISGCEEVITKIEKALAGITRAASTK